MQNKITSLKEHYQYYTTGECVGVNPPSNRELMDKVNELVDIVNQLLEEREVAQHEKHIRKDYTTKGAL